MTNLTLSIDEKVLQAARVRAVKEGTSVNEICRQAIEGYARAASKDHVRELDALFAEIDAKTRAGRNPAPVPVPWKSREEMYEQVMDERHPGMARPRRGGAR